MVQTLVQNGAYENLGHPALSVRVADMSDSVVLSRYVENFEVGFQLEFSMSKWRF